MITLAVPSKGRLMEKTFAWFASHGVTLRRTGTDRDYAAEVADLPVDLRLMSAGEIPGALASGAIHMGVTGSDLVYEKIPAWDQAVESLADMGFGHADLVIAVPAWWVDVRGLDDLDAVAADFRQAHGHRLRIATKYHRLVRDFLRDAGVADYRLIDSQGATEGTVAHGTAEAIADITSTGDTLRANHLRVLEDGLIHRSQATLFRARGADWGADEAAALKALLAKLQLD
ncbi:ATP phosphoribosyltransferase [Gymnodinialimonas sp. 2305UL16-5]|uniref:ATP phosphoribosyltransferase n=1 Tax=Gymnodinialimonas mytili TaxID=3126503 RepID=UPI00309C408C